MTPAPAKQLRESLRILERRMGALQENQNSCCEISLAQCHALVEIGRVRHIALNVLSAILNLDSSTMSRTVNNLVVRGLVQRDIDAQDRRYISIRLTQQGKELFEQIECSMDEYYHDVYQRIPWEKREQVLESLGLLVNALADSQTNHGIAVVEKNKEEMDG